MQSEQYFSRKQRALFVSSENLGWPWPPGSYAPVRIGNTDMIGNRENLYIDAIMPMQILMVSRVDFFLNDTVHLNNLFIIIWYVFFPSTKVYGTY
jgi:hypothetical protein